jgi:CDGSH-type Zn-finger protein|tara:strand:+ start:79 stop:330 length:252 start_codon:yes stop_codon:yes gene_type:complete
MKEKMNKGQKAGSSPIEFEVEKGKSYAWCVCGKSNKQPFCDGSHKGSEFKPVVFKAEETKKIYFCVCKQTNNRPFCDGSHEKY